MIKEFSGEYEFLSNFYNCPVTYNDLTYTNSEAAFQAQKTLDMREREKFTEYHAGKAKREGKKLVLRDDWEEVKEQVMYEIVLCKFSQNIELREKLLATGNEWLEEGNAWGDVFWGTVNGNGKNKLGKILMRVRQEFVESQLIGWTMAKRVDNKQWVKGFYFFDGVKHYIITQMLNSQKCVYGHSAEVRLYIVDPATVCRCTGMIGVNYPPLN